MKIPQTTTVPVREMKINEHNPRTISPDNMQRLIQNILVNPKMLLLRPTVVSDDNIPLGGNMRTEALRQIAQMDGDEIVRILEKSVTYTKRSAASKTYTLKFWRDWLPNPVSPIVRASELDPDEVRAFIILDNTAFGEYDNDALANEFNVDELCEIDPDLLPNSAIDAEAIHNGESLSTNEDSFGDDDSVKPRTEYGDLFRLGGHLLLCGDVTKIDDVKRLFTDENDRAMLVVTDPPYNVAIVGGNHAEPAETRKGAKIQNDAFESDDEAAAKLWLPAFENIRAVASDCCSIYCTMPQGITHSVIMQTLIRSGWDIRHELIWRKQSIVLGRQDYNYQHEPIAYGWNKKHQFHGCGSFATTSVWDFDRPTVSKEHPTMKPVGLFGEMMLNSSLEGEIVFDPFAGSGTTIIAAEQLNRRARCIEIDPHYCDVIIARWEKESGKEAEKL